jgi:hypothetical protein
MSLEYPAVNFKISRLTRLLSAEVMTKGKADGASAADGEAGAGEGRGRQPVGARNPSQASRDLMKNFLGKNTPKRGREDWAASPQPDQAAKRATQRDDEEDSPSWWTWRIPKQRTQRRSHGRRG